MGDILPTLIKKLKLGKKLKEHEALKLWEEVVGKMISKKAKAYRVDRGVLFVRVNDPMWLQELCLRKKEIIEKINEKIGKEVIKDINFF